MAGMLPGVECARRRRFHQSGGCSDSLGAPSNGWTRRPSFCLYRSNNEIQHNSASSLKQKSILSNQVYQDDQKLGVEAREAKERLDERLRTQRKSELKRQKNSKEFFKLRKSGDGNSKSGIVKGEVQMEVYGSKKSGSKRFSWAKLGSWRASDQEECAICLEGFKGGESLVHLACAHRFHHGCLVPWLENNAHCPCCRMGIISTQILS